MLRPIAGLACLVTLCGPAVGQQRCRVTDPSDTPLNVRTAPYGRIVGTLPNDKPVSIIDRATDRQGRPWVYVAEPLSRQPIGWVYREFISCF